MSDCLTAWSLTSNISLPCDWDTLFALPIIDVSLHLPERLLNTSKLAQKTLADIRTDGTYLLGMGRRNA